ncbi:MAG: WXG100 family type VII secretion target [Planctomycetota bacterium]
MAKAVVDPAELRRFAHDMKRFNEELLHAMRGLHGRVSALGESWRDHEQQRFAEQFEEAMQGLARFAKATDEQIPYLLRKADRAEEYLKQR